MKTKSTGRKNVLMLSTMRPITGITKDDGKSKLARMKFYNFKKGGIDIVDQWNDYYSCCARTNRWDFVSFFYILDTVRVNIKTVWCLKNLLDIKKTNTLKCSWNLSSQLTKPFIENRQINGLGTAVIHKMEKVLDRSLYEERSPGGIGKIYLLLGEIKRQCKKFEVGATKAVNDNLTKSKEQCEVCGTSVRGDHSTQICCDCIEQRKRHERTVIFEVYYSRL